MYRFYESYKGPTLRLLGKIVRSDWIFLIPFLLISLKVRMGYVLFLASGRGFPQSDDSKWYLQYAYSLIEGKPIGLHMNDIMYMGYNLLLTLLLAVFKSTTTVIFIQAAVAGLSVFFVYRIAAMLFNKTTAVIASYLYCYHSWGITLWSSYILADSFFISLLLLCVYLLLKSRETGKTSHRIAFAASAFYLALFKPTGLVAVAFIALCIAIGLRGATIAQFVRKRWLPLSVGAAAAASLCAYVLLSGKLEPLFASLQFNAKMVLYNIYAKGWIYDSPSPFDHPFKPNYDIDVMNSLIASFMINNWDHISVLYMKRAAAFLGRWVMQTDLSTVQGVAKFGENMLPTALFVLGFVAAMWNGLLRKTAVVWLLVLAVLLFCVVFFIDGMYRYKAPAVPFIIIGVAYGAERVVRCVLLAAKYAAIQLRMLRRGSEPSYRAVEER
ncbi:glycosyltransferase family 39 protein [Paenibacillus sp. GYB003]|uniref:glycosyltransferase family 39 protein n=1 Tax=Paenibacillus sp. GYB003 TaxID=2994392 RepID=UPI002F96A852